MSPADNSLYLSHAHGHQVWRVVELDPEMIDDVTANMEAVVGTGQRCLPGDPCGDGGPAVDAKLNFPKSVAIAVDKTMYIADGRTIRYKEKQEFINYTYGFV